MDVGLFTKEKRTPGLSKIERNNIYRGVSVSVWLFVIFNLGRIRRRGIHRVHYVSNCNIIFDVYIVEKRKILIAFSGMANQIVIYYYFFFSFSTKKNAI